VLGPLVGSAIFFNQGILTEREGSIQLTSSLS
jgi:hypothetical protein